jgi:signal transduction histidine kinase
MQERLGMLGGELNVDVKQGHGYRLTARVPWKASQSKNLQ